jgi:hypothetical protein
VTLTRQLNEIASTIGDRHDVPADVKSAFDAVKKDVDGLTARLAPPSGGRGGGGRGNTENLHSKIGQAKNTLMGGMVVGELTTNAFSEAKAQAPKAIADLNAVIAKASSLSTSLGKYNITLNVPQPVKAVDAAPARRSNNPQR